MHNKSVIALLYGWIVALGLILLSSATLALLIKFTTLNESLLSTTTLVIGLISLFIGGIVAGIKAKHQGWIVGILVGVGFSLLAFLIQYLGYNQMFSLKQSLYHASYIFAALVGGILGVNFVRVKE